MSFSRKRLKIAYVTATDAKDRHSWSGTDYYIWNALQKHIGEITFIRPPAPSLLIFFLKAIHGISLYAFKKRFDWRHSTLLSKAYGKKLTKTFSHSSFDLIVAPASDTLIANLTTAIPIIYINDRTIAGALGYHKMLTDLWPFSEKQSIATDQEAIKKSLFVTYPSHWAAQSAIRLYNIPQEKVHMIPFGANMDVIPPREIALSRKNKDACKLLFIGVNWKDKGGPIAYDCFIELLKMGINAEITIVGTTPPEEIKNDKLKIIPFLNKNKLNEFKKLQTLWTESSFLILPTRIDAYGIVFCEAAAYGLPSIGADTGGVSGALHNGKNGILMPFEAQGKEYALKIAGYFNDEVKYRQLALSAREEFEKELNWDAWALKIKDLVYADQ